jgi:hypothetical protein
MKPLACIGDAEPRAIAIRFFREYALQKFDEAQSSEYYVCGMQAFDVDDLMYGVIVARDGLECHHHIEFEYYNNTKILTSDIFNSKLRAYCAGASGADGIIDEQLRLMWKSVLHVCQQCRLSRALPIARTKRRNGVANEQRTQRPLLAIPTSQAPGDLDSTPSTAATTKLFRQQRV